MENSQITEVKRPQADIFGSRSQDMLDDFESYYSPESVGGHKPNKSTSRLRRSTLVRLRWAAVIGQLVAVVIVLKGLGFTLNLVPCLILIGISAILNLCLTVMAPLDRRVHNNEAIAQLCFDILQLGSLLYLTGGIQNPFCILFIAPAVTSVTTLRPIVIGTVLGVTTLVSVILLFMYDPLPWYPNDAFSAPFIFSLGQWVGLMVGVSFTSLYAWGAGQESLRMSNALAATESVLAHEQMLAALGGMAAAAAHELGTPLATIQLTAKEMARELEENTPLGEDARLMVSQAQRCREILKQLSKRGDEGDVIHDKLNVRALLDEAIEPFLAFDTQIVTQLEGEGVMPQFHRQAELIYGLTNFVENAVDFANQTVRVEARWNATHMSVRVEDDGPGFDAAVRGRLGEPYVSLRNSKIQDRKAQDRKGQDNQAQGAGGLGLGFFIAKTLIERTGGHVNFGNHKNRSGAYVNLSWPLERLINPSKPFRV